MADPVKAPLVPTVTGNPQLDTFLGYAATHVGAIAAAAAIAWMDSKGFDSKALASTGLDMPILIATTVSGILLSGGAWVWGQLRTRWSQAAIVNTAMQAVLTQTIPSSVVAKAPQALAQAVEAAAHVTVTDEAPAGASKP